MTWYTDRSRYETGFACPFSRLLKYHLDGTGFVPESEPIEPVMGHIIHSYLEKLLSSPAVTSGLAPTKDDVTSIVGPYMGEERVSNRVLDEAVGLVHAWARAVLPWLLSDFTFVSAEQEFSIDVGDDIVWMARPDAVFRSKSTGKLQIVEFKSTRSKADRVARLHATSLQSIMNAYSVASHFSEEVEAVQIHVLQIGTETWPTPITHAYYRPANPPYVPEDWQPKSRRPDGTWLGKLYRRVPVLEHRKTEDWVWSMPPSALAEVVPVLQNPLDLQVQGLKVIQALRSIRLNESHWRQVLSEIESRGGWAAVTFDDLSTLVPRTFSCQQYDRACEYTPICFETHFHSSTTNFVHISGYSRRIPHHPQEGTK